ncbi:hypothetical protein [Tellurirhabdus bombi]|uniref:hypothetical protein n=1 Tax=Tellurirhabdus bombi TaxID=2907205 RepID=UPI001F2EAB24|nr:hypothetical protein [Tellurirhabdus bombi]
MNPTLPTPPTSLSWFAFQVKSGIRYALYFMAVGFVMGAIYGVFGGLIFEPALFATSLIGVFCIVNFLVAIPAVTLNLVLAVFKKSSRPIYRYFGLSLGFAIVYLLFFYGLHLAKINVF